MSVHCTFFHPFSPKDLVVSPFAYFELLYFPFDVNPFHIMSVLDHAIFSPEESNNSNSSMFNYDAADYPHGTIVSLSKSSSPPL
jgi:hypothetical protein